MKQNRMKVLLSAAFLGGSLFAGSWNPVLAAEDVPSRAIYVVYDDSGSMYTNKKKETDRWSYAKYSMEVFASMLGDEDEMNVYYMSDYSDEGPKAGPRIELDGDTLPQKNVEKIHEERTSSGWIPFETVEAAYEDLEKSDAEEKWLVVLTDGDFQKGGETIDNKAEVTEFMDEFFEAKKDDVNVTFLAIGNDVVPISEDEDKGVYFERAENSAQILQKVTDISNRIYNMNRIEVPVKTGEFSIDVPMSQLTVFVQGEGAYVAGLQTADGISVGTMDPAVQVSATESSDNDKYSSNKPVSELQGELATFEGGFAPGSYKVMSENARMIEVYYKPDLDVSAYLTTADGTRIDDMAELPAGEYQIHFDLVSGQNGEVLPENNMISRSEDGVTYEAVIFNNRKQLDKVYGDKDTVTLDQGSLDIQVAAHFLKYNTVETDLNYSVWTQKNVEFKAEDTGKNHWILDDTLHASTPLSLTMTVQGQTPTPEQWAQVSVPKATVETDEGIPLDPPIIKKTETPGLFEIEPDPEQKEFQGSPYTEANIQIVMDESVDKIPWKGKTETTVHIEDNRSWYVKYADSIARNWWKGLLGVLLLLIAVGYIPGIKKYLPKLPKTPSIECTPRNRRKHSPSRERGSFQIDRLSTLLPFVAQTGWIRIAPSSADDLPCSSRMQVKALGANKMAVMNSGSFLSEEGIVEIDGEALNKEPQKPIELRKSSEITVKGSDYTYMCVLNEQYTPED